MSKTLPITKYRKYDAFQAIYEVRAREGQDIDTNQVYSRVILRVAGWLKKRYSIKTIHLFDIPVI